MQLDADTVSRLLKIGEEPVYLSENDLEWAGEVFVAKNITIQKDRTLWVTKYSARSYPTNCSTKWARSIVKSVMYWWRIQTSNILPEV